MKWANAGLAAAGTMLWLTTAASAVIVYNDADGNTTAPAGDQGWLSVGRFNGSSGVAISPNHFLVTQHQNGSTANDFHLNGVNYDVINLYDLPGTDLRIGTTSQVLPNYSELYTGNAVGLSVTIIGYGLHTLGADVQTASPAPDHHGWVWGATAGKSWGTNTIDGTNTVKGQPVLRFDFDPVANEGTVADNDSGGGVFVNDGGVWKLAGLNYAVEGSYSYSSTTPSAFSAAIYAGPGNASELFIGSGTSWNPAPTRPQFAFAHDIAYHASDILAVAPEPSALALVAACGVLMIRRRHAA